MRERKRAEKKGIERRNNQRRNQNSPLVRFIARTRARLFIIGQDRKYLLLIYSFMLGKERKLGANITL